jgi:hypothetical protein
MTKRFPRMNGRAAKLAGRSFDRRRCDAWKLGYFEQALAEAVMRKREELSHDQKPISQSD